VCVCGYLNRNACTRASHSESRISIVGANKNAPKQVARHEQPSGVAHVKGVTLLDVLSRMSKASGELPARGVGKQW
jgi:hypothetical protein